MIDVKRTAILDARSRAPRWRAALRAACIVANALAATCAAADFSVGAIPAWVRAVPLNLDARAPEGQLSGGEFVLLADDQIRVEARSGSSYHRTAARAVSERGLDNVANIAIEFDPSYERLTLHTLRVHRGGASTDRLGAARIKVLQRESGLESQTYDGTRTATIFLEDVRVGDVVEYAYSLAGQNAVFDNLQFGHRRLQWSVPIHDLRLRLLIPSERKITLRRNNDAPEPEVADLGNAREYTWIAHDVAPMRMESDAPGGYDPYASVDWSEFADWAAVARWGNRLFRLTRADLHAVAAASERIAKTLPDAPGRMLAALSFVQGEVRYLGIEIGPGSHAPRPPGLVLQRRYGDCKDKALLLVAMLRNLNIDAAPALVSTRLRRRLSERLPSPAAFNHAIVRVRIEGREVWLDPTRSKQAGALDRVYQPAYGYALVLDGQGGTLTSMPESGAGMRRRTVTMRFDADVGYTGDVPLTVTTVFEGASADSMRDTLSAENRSNLEHDYLNYYARSYPQLRQTADMTVRDDPASNSLTTEEHYSIPQLWQPDADKVRRAAVFSVPELRAMLRDPSDIIRKAPLRIAHPQEFALDLVVAMPEARSITPIDDEVRTGAFSLTRKVAAAGKLLTAAYRYRSLAEEVAAAEVPAYVEALKRARSGIGYTLYKSNERSPADRTQVTAKAPPWALFASFVACVLGLRYLTFRPVAPVRDNAWCAGLRRSNAVLLLIGHGSVTVGSVIAFVLGGLVTVRLAGTASWLAAPVAILSVLIVRGVLIAAWLPWAMACSRDAERLLRLARWQLLTPFAIRKSALMAGSQPVEAGDLSATAGVADQIGR